MAACWEKSPYLNSVREYLFHPYVSNATALKNLIPVVLPKKITHTALSDPMWFQQPGSFEWFALPSRTNTFLDAQGPMVGVLKRFEFAGL